MLLIALKHIPGSIQIAPGQAFYEHNPELREQLIAQGFARTAHQVSVEAAPQPVVPTIGPTRWAGKRVAILASGPSLTEEQAQAVSAWRAASNERRVIAINTTFRIAPFADVLYACDGRWWDAYFDEQATALPAMTERWTQERAAADKYGLNYIKSTNGRGLSRVPNMINQGMAGGYQAIGLAYLWGARDFVLLGYDCKGGHWHGDHPPKLNHTLPHKQWMERFAELAKDLKAEEVRVVNCSPGTALRVFPQGDFAAELAP